MLGWSPGTGWLRLLHGALHKRRNGGCDHGDGDNTFHCYTRVTVIGGLWAEKAATEKPVDSLSDCLVEQESHPEGENPADPGNG